MVKLDLSSTPGKRKGGVVDCGDQYCLSGDLARAPVTMEFLLQSINRLESASLTIMYQRF